MPECCKCNWRVEPLTSWHPLVRKWDTTPNYFTALELTENATEEEIKWTYEGFHIGVFSVLGHEHVDSADADKQKLTDAYEFLRVEENRQVYKRYVCFNRGVFSKARWQALTVERRNQWPCLAAEAVLSFILIIMGLVISALPSNTGPLYVHFTVALVAGSIVGAGIMSVIHLMSVESVVEQGRGKWYLATDGYVRKLLGGLVGGGVGGLFTAGVSLWLLGYPVNSNLSLGLYVGESILSVAVDIYMFTLADGLLTGSYQESSSRAVVIDLLLTLISGSVAGALGGLVLGGSKVVDEFVSALLTPLTPFMPQLLQILFSVVTCSCRNITKESTTAIFQKSPSNGHVKLQQEGLPRDLTIA